MQGVEFALDYDFISEFLYDGAFDEKQQRRELLELLYCCYT